MDLLANEVDDIASLQKRLELAMLEFPGLKFAVSFQVVGICWTFFTPCCAGCGPLCHWI